MSRKGTQEGRAPDTAAPPSLHATCAFAQPSRGRLLAALSVSECHDIIKQEELKEEYIFERLELNETHFTSKLF